MSIHSTELSLRERKDAKETIIQLEEQGGLDHLSFLDLEYSEIDDSTLQSIGKRATALTKLNLNACQAITDNGLKLLSEGLTSLTTLSLYWDVKVGDEGVSAICKANKGINDLRLSGCKLVTDAGLSEAVTNCTGLCSLDLTRCSKVSNSGLQEISDKCTNLQVLLLYACSGFGDKGVSAIAKRLHLLDILDLCGAGDLTDAVRIINIVCLAFSLHYCMCWQGLEPCASGSLSALRKLNLGWCPKLTDRCLDSLAAGCTSLQYLYLLGNPNMTIEGLKSLSRGCTMLCGMDICGLKVPDRSMEAMKPLFPNLTSLAKLGQAPNYDDY